MIVHFMGVIVLILGASMKVDIFLIYMRSLFPDLWVGSHRTLLVGVLSAPGNIRARKTIRETWGQFLENRSIDMKFLVGDEICPYPLEDRVTPYDCNLWRINLPKVVEEYSTVGGQTRNDGCDVGFTFIVKTRILLRRLGLDYVVFSGNSTDKARVVLLNSKNGKKVASATFLKEPIFGFIWKPIPPITLEEGFEGEIKLIGDGLQKTYCDQILQYFAPIYYFETLDASGAYKKFELGNFRSSLVGMNYSLEDKRTLEELLVKRVSRFENWKLTKSLIKRQLEDEQKKYGDILFLGGFIDVYDNLSFKVAVFLDWVKFVDNWKYILKTDDDVFVDLPLIEEELKNTWDLWTCIRNQAPNPSGKWRDRNSIAYPPFPSGSGYILSREVIRNLQLQPKGKVGEDVAMGLALGGGVRSPVDPPCCWACGATEPDCEKLCNMAELQPSQLKKLWEIYTEVGHIPTYHEM